MFEQVRSIRRYAFAKGLYLERFDDEALLLVAARDRLLTVNAAAADLFAEFSQAFGDRHFTVVQGSAWLADHYEIAEADCLTRVRNLLAFGLRHGLVQHVLIDR